MLNGKYIIGYCCTTIQKEPVKPLLYSMIDMVSKRDDMRMLVFQCFEDLYFTETLDTKGAVSVFETINYDMVDVLLLQQQNEKQTEFFDGLCRKALSHGVPVISVDYKREGAYNVDFGYGEAFSDIVEHLVTKHGCKNLVHVAGQRNNSFSRTRIDSFAEVLKRHGLPFREEDVLYGEFWDFPTGKAMDEFFASGKPLPDAFVCANDSMAITVCRKLVEKGYSVPDDVFVTGFDGIETEKYHNPRLTTAARDNDAVAGAIFDICDKIFKEGCTQPFNTEVFYKTRWAESCGCGEHRSAAGSNFALSEFIRAHDGVTTFQEAMHRMGAKVAMEPTLENAKFHLKHSSFWGTTICISEEFSRCNTEDISPFSEDIFNNVSEAYPENMLLLFANINDEEIPAHEGEIFPTSSLLPNLYQRFPDSNTIIVSPLHSQETVIGYMLSVHMLIDSYFESLNNYNMMASRCLEVLRTHEHMAFLNRKLEFMFTHDHLTKIYNRYGFYKDFREDFTARKHEKHKDVFIVSIDLNDMKTINDTYGHHSGDDALCITANALVNAAEKSGVDVICSRFGGDEFVVARVCCGDAEQLVQAYRKGFDEALAELNASSGRPYTVSASIGAYCSSLENVDTVDELIDLADRMMYNDKARHKRRPKAR